MRVLLVNPSRAGRANVPVNLPLLQGLLKAAGHEVRLFDFSDYVCFQPAAVAAELGHASGGKWKSPEQFFKPTAAIDESRLWVERASAYPGYPAGWATRGGNGVLRQGDPATDFDILCCDFHPEVVGLSALTVDFPLAAGFLSTGKLRHGFRVIVGGAHARSAPQHCIASPVVDALCCADGEEAILEYLMRLDQGCEERTSGMWVKKGGEIHRNPGAQTGSLDHLPTLDFVGFDPGHFYRPFDGRLFRMLNFSWSRGCPYACSYCINATLAVQGLGRVRRKRPEVSVAELAELVGRYGFDFVRFWDEDFAATPARELAEFSELYRRRVGLPFLVYSRADSLTEGKVKILREMGCVTVAMGIESGSAEIRRTVLNRRISNQELIEAFRLVHSQGIRSSAYNIIGLPGENREKVFETIALNRQAPMASCSCTLLEPYFNTPIRRLCEEDGLPQSHFPSYDSLLGSPQYVPRGMSRGELEGLFRTFGLYVYLPRHMYSRIQMAEQPTPEGYEIFQELIRLKTEQFQEKPSYEESMSGVME